MSLRTFTVGAALAAGLLAVFAPRISAQGDNPYSELRFKYEVGLEAIRLKFQKKSGTLFDGYAGAANRLQTQFQKDGDLENAVKARTEAETARTHRKTGNDSFPGIDNLRQVLGRESEKLTAARQEETIALLREHVSDLDALKVAITKSGDLDGALKIDGEIKQHRAALSRMEATTTKSAPETKEPAAANKPSTPRSSSSNTVQSPLNSTKPLTGTIELEPGLHRLTVEQVKFGDRSITDKAARGCNVTVPPGTEIEGSAIYVDVGRLDAKGAIFRGIAFTQNLHGDVTAEDCLFDGCTMEKGGGWSGGEYSTHWIFENCVFSKSSFANFRKGKIGIQIKECTFYDVPFPVMEYREDAGAEATGVWRSIEFCRFINCDIPESVYMATENCIFEKCRFTGPDPMPTGTALSTKLYIVDPPEKPLPAGPDRSYDVRDASSMAREPGAKLPHSYSGGRLEAKR